MAVAKLAEEDIFNVARKIDSLDARADYLNQVCSYDNALRGRIDALLQVHEQEKSFLQPPPAAVTSAEAPAEVPGNVIGPYKLLQQIGEGGFGVVFMAEQQQPMRRKVALKVIKPGMDTRQVIARFEAERQALAVLDHPNIAKVFDAGATDSGRPFFVMELVKGVPITRYCDEGHLPPRERLGLFVSVCHAVQHAHQKGIIHRDLKPSNILVTVPDGQPSVKIIDFGIAKATGGQLTDKTLFTGFAQMIGTPPYMSPEQAGQSLDIDTRSDIYSLGVLLYELLTGTTPFHKERFKTAAYDEIRRILREEEPPKPSTRLSESKDTLAAISAQRQTEPAKMAKLVRGELDWIVMKALDKDRNRRYETATVFAMDVRHYLADEPVQACPPSAGYRLRKFVRRNKLALAMAACLFTLIMVPVVGASWEYRQTAQLTEMAKEGLAAGKLAMAEQNFAEAQRRLAQTSSKLETRPSLAAQFRPELEELLREAEVRLRLQRFKSMAAEARYFTLPVIYPTLNYGEDSNRLNMVRRLREARNRCRDALRLFGVLDNRHWQEELGNLPLAEDKLASLKTPVAELVFLLAEVEFSEGRLEGDQASGAKQALALLQQAESLVPNLRALYIFRSAYFGALEKIEAARESTVQAEKIKATTWLDHFLVGMKLWGASDHYRAVPSLESAIAQKPDDYWSWYAWGRSHSFLGHPDRARWAMDVCIALRPHEATAWIERAANCGPALESGLSDVNRGLELATVPQLRAVAYAHRGIIQQQLGRLEAAFQDFDQSVQIWPTQSYHYLLRAKNQRARGHTEQARADARKCLESTAKGYATGHGIRAEAYEILGQIEEVVRETLAMLRTETNPEFHTSHRALLARTVHRLQKSFDPNGAGAGRHGFLLAQAYWHIGHVDLAKDRFEQALQWRKQHPDQEALRPLQAETAELLAKTPRPPAAAEPCHQAAWHLTTSADSGSRNYPLAIDLARQTIKFAPNEARYWATLGIAQYQAGNWKEAAPSLEKAVELRGKAPTSWELFVLAMSHWQQGKKEMARNEYRQAVQWMERNDPGNATLLEFRAQAAELLGVKVDTVPKKDQPTSKK